MTATKPTKAKAKPSPPRKRAKKPTAAANTEKTIATGYAPRPHQADLHNQLQRFNVLVTHRRFGKTVFAVNELIDRALRCDLARPRYGYIAPFSVQAKTVAWDYLKAWTAMLPQVKARETDLAVDLPNGARISLYGADNPDRLRGLYFDGVILDEYGDMPPRLWGEIIRPALADREGFAVFIGTPRGKNHFYDLYEQAGGEPDWYRAILPASKTGILAAAELLAAQKVMSADQYAQEFECSFAAAVSGAYFAEILRAIEGKGQIGQVPYDPILPVETWWDLGIGDATAIWFAQRAGREIRLIDYYEASNEGLPHYARVLQHLPYVYSRHLAPHDIGVRELGSGKTRLEIADSLGVRFDIAPRLTIEDGIEAMRAMLPQCWFDSEKCRRGLTALAAYRKDYDEAMKNWRSHPRHDWSSHACDALRMGAVARPPAAHSGSLIYPKNGIV
ncbi:MAG: hypothetical protein QM537_03435 [Candidatus Symbiobacter sp.]|nr:hypothetical protein [Candidatus Symbiobacter sp.]